MGWHPYIGLFRPDGLDMWIYSWFYTPTWNWGSDVLTDVWYHWASQMLPRMLAPQHQDDIYIDLRLKPWECTRWATIVSWRFQFRNGCTFCSGGGAQACVDGDTCFDVAMVACSELVKSPRTGARMTALEASSVYDDNDTVSDEAQEASKVLKKASGWLKCLASALGAIDDLAGMPDRITLQTIREANPYSPTGVKTEEAKAFRKSIRGIIASMADF